jgi:hypothetical protein
MKTVIVDGGVVTGVALHSDDATISSSTTSGNVIAVADGDPVALGWTHNNVDGKDTFAPPASPPLRKKLSPVEFKLQFTSAERLAIRAARSYSGNDATKTMFAEAIDDFFDIVDDPRLTNVDLDHPQTIEGVEALAAAGLITTDRAAVILAGVVE